MSQGDTIRISGVIFKILKRDGLRMLLGWTESTGVEKTRWLIIKGVSK